MQEYVNKTYGEHYAQTKFQTTEFIIDQGHGIGFTVGNIIKYAQRYGKKDGRNRKDILKVLHYALIMLYVHDLELESQQFGWTITVPGPELLNETNQTIKHGSL